jgi:hypothetical protein
VILIDELAALSYVNERNFLAIGFSDALLKSKISRFMSS